MAGWHIGVLTDADIDDVSFLEGSQQLDVASSFGVPSGPVAMGRIGGVRFTFLARLGAGRSLISSEVNHRANIDVLKRCGVTDVLAISGVMPLHERLADGGWMLVDQVIDCTSRRDSTFFGDGLAATADLANPVCPRLSAHVVDGAEAEGLNLLHGACISALDGARGPTGAEQAVYRQWGADAVGFAAMPEAALAREAELPYAMLGCAVARLGRRPAQVPGLFHQLAAALPLNRDDSPIDRALDGAIMTAPVTWDRRFAMRLDAVAGRILKQGRPDWF